MSDRGLTRAVFGLFPLVFLGCASDVSFPLTASADDLLVIATGRSDSLEVRTFGGAGGHLDLDLEEGETFSVYQLRPEDFVDTSGAPLAPETLRSAQIHAPGRAVAACGRCLWTAPEAPEVLYPGSTCRLPAWSLQGTYALQGSEVHEVSEEPAPEVELSWPGECGCSEARKEPSRLTSCRHFPTKAPPDHPILFNDGSVLYHLDGQIVLSATTGASHMVDAEFQPDQIVVLSDADHPSIVVAEQPDDHLIRVEILEIGARGEVRQVFSQEFPSTGFDSLLSSSNGAFMSLIRKSGNRDESVYFRCRSKPEPTCVEEPLDGCPGLCRAKRVFDLPDGREALVTGRSEVFVLDGGRWSGSGAIALPPPLTRMEAPLQALAWDGSNALTCGFAESRLGVIGMAIVRFGLSGGGTLESELLRFEPYQPSCDMFRDGDRLIVSFQSKAMSFTLEGGLRDEKSLRLEGWPELPGQIFRVRKSGDVLMVWIPGRSLYRLRPPQKVELLSGLSDDEIPPGLEAMVVADGDFLAFEGLHRRWRLSPEEGCGTPPQPEDLQGGLQGVRATSAAFEPQSGRVAVATSTSGHFGVHWVDADHVSPALASPVELTRAEAASNGTVWFLGSDRAVYRLKGDDLDKVEELGSEWWTISSGNGVLFLGGDRRMARVLPGRAQEYRVEILDELVEQHTRQGVTFRAGPVLTAARASCADQAVFVGVERTVNPGLPDPSFDSRRGSAWEVSGGNGLTFDNTPQLNYGSLATGDVPVALLRSDAAYLVQTQHGVSAGNVLYRLVAGTQAAVNIGSVGLISGHRGELQRVELLP